MDIFNLLNTVGELQQKLEYVDTSTGRVYLTDPNTGELTPTWEKVSDINIAISNSSGLKNVSAGTALYNKEYVIYTDYNEVIREGMRLFSGGTYYYIYRVFNPNQMNNHLELICDVQEYGS